MSPVESIHIIAIGGTGVAPLACLLKREGYQVRGSDGPLYPPMSTLLEREGIRPLLGFEPSHLEPRPDLVIVGNAVPRTNPEVVELERLGWPRLSMPEALARYFLAGRDPVVVAGTHGKTTTTTLAAFTYERCGREPGYLVGGQPRDLENPFAKGRGRRFIVEGDEYNAAYFDRGPKFLHYRPQTVILTGAEHDHVDLYPDLTSFRAAFRALIELVPPDGHLIADFEAPGVAELLAHAQCPVTTYGLGTGCDVHPIGDVDFTSSGTRFSLRDDGREVPVELGLPGEHNLRNALAVWALARGDGLPVAGVLESLRSFRGAHRRLEVVADRGGIVVVDDFAHHPTEIAKTLEALRQRYPGRRLVAVFEPRSLTSGRSFFYERYLDAFGRADRVHLAPVFHASRLRDDERVDLERLAEDLSARGVATRAWRDLEALAGGVAAELEAGDVVVTMSSGSFGGLPARLAGGI